MPRWENHEANFRWRITSQVEGWNREMVTQNLDGTLYECSEKNGAYTIAPMSKASAKKWREEMEQPPDPEPFVFAVGGVELDAVTFTEIDSAALSQDDADTESD